MITNNKCFTDDKESFCNDCLIDLILSKIISIVIASVIRQSDTNEAFIIKVSGMLFSKVILPGI